MKLLIDPNSNIEDTVSLKKKKRLFILPTQKKRSVAMLSYW